jgi:hypothetical protein
MVVLPLEDGPERPNRKHFVGAMLSSTVMI